MSCYCGFVFLRLLFLPFFSFADDVGRADALECRISSLRSEIQQYYSNYALLDSDAFYVTHTFGQFRVYLDPQRAIQDLTMYYVTHYPRRSRVELRSFLLEHSQASRAVRERLLAHCNDLNRQIRSFVQQRDALLASNSRYSSCGVRLTDEY
ncbi:MAG: hypothetical protein KC736_00995 [Candidatus Moranbacteria bacterium]|nr:hypothetical protein [Candidatus Moranbacteria bacterium]